MGSVQSETECPKCKYDGCFSDYYYKTDELYLSCRRCGFFYSRTLIIDKEKGKEIHKKVKKLYDEAKYDEALKVAEDTGWIRHTGKGEKGILDWGEEEKRRHIKNRLDNEEYKTRYIKFDKEGRRCFDEVEEQGIGTYYVMNKKGGGEFGIVIEPKDRTKLKEGIRKNKDKLSEGYYTYKHKGEWKIHDVLNNKKFKHRGSVEGMYEFRGMI